MKAGLGLLVIIGLYVAALIASGRAAETMCADHPVGTPVADLETLEAPFLLSRMGPTPEADIPDAEFAIYCASMTMCDNSCRLSVKDGVVIEARHSAL